MVELHNSPRAVKSPSPHCSRRASSAKRSKKARSSTAASSSSTRTHVVIDIGYKSEGQVPLEEFRGADGNVTRQGGRRRRSLPREPRERHRPVRPLEGEGRSSQGLGRDLRSVRARRADRRRHHAAREGRPLGHHPRRRQGVPARARRSTSARCATSTRSSARTSSSRSSSSTRSAATSCSRAACSSRRSAPSSRSQTLEKLKEGQIVEGIVKNLTEYGAFIDLGGIDGLLHITDMSWGRVNHPSELFQVGDHVRVKVLKFNSETERVSLGLKQITEDPWKSAPERYTPGTVVKGKVVSLKDYGAFIELEQGIEGLVHVSEMSLDPPREAPVEDGRRRRRGRGGRARRRPVAEPHLARHEAARAEPVRAAHRRSTRRAPSCSGKVRNIADFGIFVEIEEGIDGLVHISDMSWTQRVKHPSELFQKGDEVEAVRAQHRHRRGRQAEDLARHQAARSAIRGIASRSTTRSARSSTARSRRSSTSARSSSSRRASRASIHVSEISRRARRGSAHGAQARPGREGRDHLHRSRRSARSACR